MSSLDWLIGWWIYLCVILCILVCYCWIDSLIDWLIDWLVLVIVGVGDFELDDVTMLPDPCPLPNNEKKRSLNEKEKLVYAPFSGMGGVQYDKDAIYINTGGSHSHRDHGGRQQKESRPHKPTAFEQLLESFKSSAVDDARMDEKLRNDKFMLMSGATAVTGDEFDAGNQQPLSGPQPGHEIVEDSGRKRRRVLFDSDHQDDGMEDDDGDDEEEEEDDDMVVEERPGKLLAGEHDHLSAFNFLPAFLK